MQSTEFDDPNLDKDRIVFGMPPSPLPSSLFTELLTNVVEDDSPYPEVRSAVSNTDDPEMPVNTLRVWVLGIIFAMVIPGLNQFFFFRYPAVTITGVRIQCSTLIRLFYSSFPFPSHMFSTFSLLPPRCFSSISPHPARGF